MTTLTCAHDPRSTSELLAVALTQGDEELRWNAIGALHLRGTREIFETAAAFCRSTEAKERALGADILAQLGVPERSFPDESFESVVALLSDTDTVL